jgi:hypothetical protein
MNPPIRFFIAFLLAFWLIALLWLEIDLFAEAFCASFIIMAALWIRERNLNQPHEQTKNQL